jgi:hypothetical protein
MKEEMMVIKRLYEKISNETDYYKYASIEVKNKKLLNKEKY